MLLYIKVYRLTDKAMTGRELLFFYIFALIFHLSTHIQGCAYNEIHSLSKFRTSTETRKKVKMKEDVKKKEMIMGEADKEQNLG